MLSAWICLPSFGSITFIPLNASPLKVIAQPLLCISHQSFLLSLASDVRLLLEIVSNLVGIFNA